MDAPSRLANLPAMLRPLIGISACVKTFNNRQWHAVNAPYVEATVEAVGGVPLLLPAVGRRTWDGAAGRAELDRLLGLLDGLVLTGSPSNVEPHHFGQESREGTAHDAERDATTLPLIRRAVETGVPIMAICRGLQELNVALGGTLHQHVHEVDGRADHRSPRVEDIEVKYGPAHPVAVQPGGTLHRLLGATEAIVNSLHGQGIDVPAPGLAVEATAPDGQIEAVSLPGARAFTFAVQWHPEWRALENPVSMKLFGAFAEACRARAAERAGGAARLAAE